MKSEELRGKIKEIALHHVSDTNCVDEDGMTTAILSLLETAITEAEPNIKEILKNKSSVGQTETYEKYFTLVIEGYKLGISNYKSNLLALVRGEKP